jgi:hypothetical protein
VTTKAKPPGRGKRERLLVAKPRIEGGWIVIIGGETRKIVWTQCKHPGMLLKVFFRHLPVLFYAGSPKVRFNPQTWPRPMRVKAWGIRRDFSASA